MEEIRGTEALEQEIREDARRRAERILRKAENDVKEWNAQREQRLQEEIEALTREYEAKKRAAEQDMESHLPLEKTRLEIGYRDEALRAKLSEALKALIREKPWLLGSWCLACLRRQQLLIQESSAQVVVSGLDAKSLQAIKTLFERAPNVSIVQKDVPLPRGDAAVSDAATAASAGAAPEALFGTYGVVVEPKDHSYRISATGQELFEWLLDEKRGELATALFGSSK
ncbi:MAG TPA: hypothetical protein PK759_02670 [Spirochaetales bacterium]|nr:hypothetical protein [Spirochaetales bacterium]HPS14684.1 hypothetical protein [Spirochaetales bacterium]